MPHPIMFDNDDPVLVRLREVALAFPDATEQVAHGRPTFRCGKQFGVYGGGKKGGDPFPNGLLFKVDPAEQTALEQDSRFWIPAYYGPYGWLGLDLSIKPDWSEVAELLDASYRQIAPKRALKRLDDGEGPTELGR